VDGGEPIERRPFIVRFLAGAIGAVVGLVPLVAGAIVFLNPLRKAGADGKRILVANLNAVPPDGQPYRFQIIDERIDAWNLYPPGPVGAVYLIRDKADAKPVAFSAVCPHLGCSVDFLSNKDQFKCPCHNSSWELDGVRIRPETCPSPRDLDSLDVDVQGNDIYVYYQKFRSGISRKVPE
jgi:menaquinol-cytochrome c reductase iron-sulfur subunit